MTAKLVSLNSFEGHRECHYALILDTYTGLCPVHCTYCYTQQGDFALTRFTALDLSDIKNEFHIAFETQKSGKYSDILRKRVPIRIGGFVECFPDMETEVKVTLELLKLLKKYDYPCIMITKSQLVTQDCYLELLDADRCAVQFSIPFYDDKFRNIIEPNGITIERRLECIRVLREKGLFVSARINPLFPMYPDGSFSTNQFDMGSEVGIFNVELFEALRNVGTSNIIAGFVHLNNEQMSKLSKQLHVDLFSLMTKENQIANKGFVYTPQEVFKYLEFLKQKANHVGIPLSPCYLGQEDSLYQQLKPLFCDSGDCCNLQNDITKISAAKSGTSMLSLGLNVKNMTFTQKLAKFILDNIKK